MVYVTRIPHRTTKKCGIRVPRLGDPVGAQGYGIRALTTKPLLILGGRLPVGFEKDLSAKKDCQEATSQPHCQRCSYGHPEEPAVSPVGHMVARAPSFEQFFLVTTELRW